MSRNQGTGSGPGDEHDGTWTNETLPLEVRRELLDRELQNFITRKRQQVDGASAPSRPVADGPESGEHAG